LLVSFSTIVFGVCLGLGLLALTRAHTHTALTQASRELFYVGSSPEGVVPESLRVSKLQARLEQRFAAWPIRIGARVLAVEHQQIQNLSFARVTAEFWPLNLAFPGLATRETALVVIEDA
jgi:hypothetical protein